MATSNSAPRLANFFTVSGVAATRVLEADLFETKATDPFVFSGVVILLAVTGLAAAAVPAWRATRIDPAEVLRADGDGGGFAFGDDADAEAAEAREGDAEAVVGSEAFEL